MMNCQCTTVKPAIKFKDAPFGGGMQKLPAEIGLGCKSNHRCLELNSTEINVAGFQTQAQGISHLKIQFY